MTGLPNRVLTACTRVWCKPKVNMRTGAVIGLAAAFHHQIIAQDVERVDLGEMLLQLGCERAQGFFIGPRYRPT